MRYLAARARTGGDQRRADLPHRRLRADWLLVQDGAKTKIAVVVNAAASKAEGERTYKTLVKACDTSKR